MAGGGILRQFLVRIETDADLTELTAYNNALLRFDKNLTLAGFAVRSILVQLGVLTTALGAGELLLGGVAAAGVGLTGVVAHLTSETRRQARAVDMSTANLQKLRLALQTYTISADKATDIVSSLIETRRDAAAGDKKAAEALRALGIGVRELQDMKPWQMFRRVANATRTAEDKSQALLAVQDIFGKALGQDILPLLDQGSEGIRQMGERFEKFGAILDEETLEGFEELKRTGMDLWIVFRALARGLATRLLPHVQDLADGILEAVDANAELIDQKLDEWASFIAGSIEYTVETFHRWRKAIKSVGGISNILEELRDVLGSLAMFFLIGYFVNLARTIGGRLVGATIKLRRVFAFLKWAMLDMSTAVAALTIKWSGFVSSLTVGGIVASGGSLLAVIAILAALALVLEDVWTWVRGGKPSLTGAFVAWMKELGATKRLVESLKRLGMTFVDALNSMGVEVQDLQDLFGLGLIVVLRAVAGVLTFVLDLVTALVNGFRFMMELVSLAIKGFKLFAQAVTGLGNSFKTTQEFVKDTKQALQAFSDIFTSLFAGTAQFLTSPFMSDSSLITTQQGAQRKAAVAAGGVSTRAQRGTTVVDNSTRKFEINQAPGQSAEAVADKIDEKEKEQARRLKEAAVDGKDI